jgi:translocation and assembly module TamB
MVLAIVFLAVLPWLLSNGFARSQIDAGLTQAFTPGKVRFETIELGWFQPTRLSKVTLLDPEDKVVARVPVAVLDRSLFHLIFSSRSPMVLSLDDTALEVERSESGRIDLVEALKTIVAHPDPNRDRTIRIDHGTLRYSDPLLAEPSTADTVDLILRIPTAPHPVTWSLKLARKDSRLEVQGEFDRWLSKGGSPKSPELIVGVVGQGWPFVAKVADVDAQGRLEGTLDFARKRGKWVLSGDARLQGLRARGKPFAGDTLAIENLEAGWDFLEGDQGWTIRRLGLTSSLGSLKAEGQLNGTNGTGQQRVEGKIDLAAIAQQLPNALRLREGLSVKRGSAQLAIELNSHLGSSTYDVEARIADLVARDQGRELTLREPATLTGRLIRSGQNSTVERLTLKTSFVDASASGRLEDGVKLDAKLDLEGLRRQLGDWIDLDELKLAGQVVVSGNYRVLGAGVVDPGEDRPNPAALGAVPNLKIPPSSLASARYLGRMQAVGRDLQIGGIGLGSTSIRRESLAIHLGINGEVGATGLPEGWNSVFIKGKTGNTEVGLSLEPDGNSTRMMVQVRSSLGSNDPAVEASLDVQGRLSADYRTLSFQRIDLRSSDVRRAIVAGGKLDLGRGELELHQLAGEAGDFAIAPDGLRLSGLGQGIGSLRFDGGLTGDVGELDHLVAHLAGRAPVGLTGKWSAQAQVRGQDDGLRIASKIDLTEAQDISESTSRPTFLSLVAQYSPKLDRLDFHELGISTAYGTLDARGSLIEPMGARRIELNGKLAPDFGAITALLASKVERGAKIEGQPRIFKASGSWDDSSGGWKGIDAEFGFDLLGADIYGMKFGASAVVVRSKNGKIAFDPISTTINEGHIRLEPELDLEAPGGPTIRLAKNSSIRDAKINDEVSKRVLAFVAPILDQTTRASGFVSVDLDHAEFPIGAGVGRKAIVEGAVVFQDVEFAPGPLASDLLGAIGRRDLSLKLDQPVTLTIADGRINQRGMSIPIGEVTRLELTGWVDFDRNLGLVATVPVSPAMLGNNPLLSDIIAGTKVQLPIGGTLDHPQIDKQAFSKNLQELGKTLLARGATRGAMELLMRLTRPKDPDAPPPPPRLTPQERKAQRQEKKAIRRGEIPPTQPDGTKP